MFFRLLSLALALLLPLAAFAQTGAPEIAPSAVGITVHVSPSGNDTTGTGSAASPFRTVKRGISVALSRIASQHTGARVLIAPGVYLESPDSSLTTINLGYPAGGHPLVIEGAGWSPGVHTGDVILTGAQPHGGWVASGDGTHTAPWPHNLPRLNPAQIGVGPGVNYPEIVGRMERLFVNDQAYLQVEGPNDPTLAHLAPGEGAFWIDDAAQTITARPPAGANFASAEIEAVVRARLIHAWRHSSQAGTPAPLVFRNLVVRRTGEYSLFLQNANGVTIEDSAFIDARISNLVLQGNNQTVRNVLVAGAGLTGFLQDGRNLLVEDFRLHDNGRQALVSRFLGWAYGGMKLGQGVDVAYRRWEVLRSSGVGVWLDTGCRNVVFEDSLIADGTTAALFIEHNNQVSIPGLGSSPTVTVRRNVIVRHPGLPGVTTGKGVQLAASQNVLIEDNLIAENQRALNFPSDSRGPQSDIVVRRNLIGSKLASHPLYWVEYGTSGWSDTGAAFDTFNSTTNDNLYLSPASTPFLNRSKVQVNFANWKSAHLNNSFNVNPAPADRAVDSRSVFLAQAYADQALVQIERIELYRQEDGLTVDGFRLRRLAASLGAPLTVQLSAGGTAVPDRDYVAFPASITFPAGAREIIVPFTSIVNGLDTGFLTVELSIAPGSGYFATAPTASFFLEDAENQRQIVSVTALTDTASEAGPTPALLRFTRIGPPDQPLTVTYTLGGNANPARFPGLTGTFQIPAGSESAVLAALPLDDTTPQLTQTLTVTVATTTQHLPGSPASASIRVLDNDTVIAPEGLVLAPGSAPAELAIQVFNPSPSAQTFTLTFPPSGPADYAWQDSTVAGGPAYEWFDLHAVPGKAEITELRGKDDHVTEFANGQSGALGGIPLGFAFPFFGSAFSEVWVSSNGTINFGARGLAPFSNTSLPAPANTLSNLSHTAHLLPFWDDLRLLETSPASRAYYARPDAQTFVLNVENIRHFSDNSRLLTFQVVLRADGEIRFNYQLNEIPFNTNVTVGLQGPVSEGTPVVQISHNADYVRSGMSIRIRRASGWLSAAQLQVTVPAGQSAFLPLTLDPGDLPVGDYSAFVTVTGSHPDQPPVVLPVTLSISAAIPPPAPATFAAAPGGATTIDLAWSAVPGAQGYRLEVSADGGLTWQSLAEIASPATSFRASGLTPGDVRSFRIRSFNTSGPSAASPAASVALPPASRPLELWWALRFDRLQPAEDGPSALLADPNGSGRPNLLEYALGYDPLAPASAAPTQSRLSDLKFEITFFRAAPDLTYEVLGSYDLQTWSVLATNPGEVGQLFTFADPVPMADHPRRFLRLRVTDGEVETVLRADAFANGLSAFGFAQGQDAGAADGFAWSSSPGVGGAPGRVNLIGSANHRDWVLHGSQMAPANPGSGAIAWQPGIEYVARLYFLTGPTLNLANIFEAGTGFVRNTFSGGFTHHVAGSGVGGGIRQQMLRIYQQGNVVATASQTITYQPNTWYELEVRLILQNGTTAAWLSADLYARGTDGLAPRQTIATVSAENVAIGNSGFNASTFFSGFSGGNNTGSNLAALDNWSVSEIR